jgi:hypothetical protein
MADTKHAHAPAISSGPTEGDGVDYRGLIWFGVILTATVVVCQVLMWGMWTFLERQHRSTDAARSPLAPPIGAPAPPPNLLTDEPGNLDAFRAHEDQILTTYGWMDKNNGVVRIPVSRAKELILQHGLPVRSVAADKTEKTDARKK